MPEGEWFSHHQPDAIGEEEEGDLLFFVIQIYTVKLGYSAIKGTREIMLL